MDPGTGSQQKRSGPDLTFAHRLQSEKARATARKIDGQIAVHRPHDRPADRPADRQPQPGAVAIIGTAAPRKLFKKHRDIVARDTTAIVDDVDAKDTIRGMRPQVDLRILRGVVFHRVGQNIDQHLPHTVGIRADPQTESGAYPAIFDAISRPAIRPIPNALINPPTYPAPGPPSSPPTTEPAA